MIRGLLRRCFPAPQRAVDADAKKLVELAEILFPPMKLREEAGQRYYIDNAADSNLAAALSDVSEGYCDEISQRTIRHVLDQLVSARRLLRPETTAMDPTVNTVVFCEDLEDAAAGVVAVEDR